MLRDLSSTEDDDFMSWSEEDARTSALTLHHKIVNLVNRWLHSRSCSFFYIGMIMLNLFLIGWVIFSRGYPTHWLFITLEVFINVALVGEVVFKLIAQKRRFFAAKSNWFDLVVTLLCVVSLGLYFGGPSTMEEIDDMLAIFLLIFRYGMQFLRLVLFVKNNQQRLGSFATDVILLDADDEGATRLAAHGPLLTGGLHAEPPAYDSDEDDDTGGDINADYNQSTIKLRFEPLAQ